MRQLGGGRDRIRGGGYRAGLLVHDAIELGRGLVGASQHGITLGGAQGGEVGRAVQLALRRLRQGA